MNATLSIRPEELKIAIHAIKKSGGRVQRMKKVRSYGVKKRHPINIFASCTKVEMKELKDNIAQLEALVASGKLDHYRFTEEDFLKA